MKKPGLEKFSNLESESVYITLGFSLSDQPCDQQGQLYEGLVEVIGG